MEHRLSTKSLVLMQFSHCSSVEKESILTNERLDIPRGINTKAHQLSGTGLLHEVKFSVTHGGIPVTCVFKKSIERCGAVVNPPPHVQDWILVILTGLLTGFFIPTRKFCCTVPWNRPRHQSYASVPFHKQYRKFAQKLSQHGQLINS
jgi:hypothetical protein